MLRRIFKPALAMLKPDSVVWVHNRPDYAAAIESEVRAAGRGWSFTCITRCSLHFLA